MSFLIGVAVGSGIVALAAERGGADFLLAINAGRMRNMGAPSAAGMLPIRDAARMTESFAVTEVLNQVRIPVLLGVDCWGAQADPRTIARRVADLGFAGAVNFPSSMHYSPAFQHILGRAGRDIAREVEILAEVQALGLKSVFYCATRTQARLGADARLDMIVLNLGWNAGGAFGHRKRQSVGEAGVAAREIGRFVKRIHPGVKFLLEGGPIVTADDLGEVLSVAPIDGYVGGSTIERLPLEASVAEKIAAYRFASRRQRDRSNAAASLASWGKAYGFAGHSPALAGFLGRLKLLAEGHMPVHITYEPGTDYQPCLSAFAGAARRRAPYVVRPDAATHYGPAERRIFGSARADGGAGVTIGAIGGHETDLLVIHEPGRLAPRIQTRLARALREGRFVAPGSRRGQPVTARCLFLSARSPSGVPHGTLMAELADVLAPWTIGVPPLRERQEELPELVAALTSEAGLAPAQRPVLSDAAMQRLMTHDWPGNVRELRRLIGHLAQHHHGAIIERETIAATLAELSSVRLDADEAGRTEKTRIVEALWRHGFHRGQTARALGISRKTLYNKIRRYGLSG